MTSVHPARETNTVTLKKQLARLYNKVYQDMFGLGVRSQKIELFKDKIIIFGQHKRVPALDIISERFDELLHAIDAALVTEFKINFKREVERLLNARVIAVLKDYDPDTELACTVIYLEKPFF